MKGGYQASSRLTTTLDEIHMEAQAAAISPSAEVWRRAFIEIARLARDANKLVNYMNGGQPPLALAGA